MLSLKHCKTLWLPLISLQANAYFCKLIKNMTLYFILYCLTLIAPEIMKLKLICPQKDFLVTYGFKEMHNCNYGICLCFSCEVVLFR